MPLYPQWNEKFKYSNHQRTRQCVICAAYKEPNQLKAIKARRQCLIYYNKQIVLHSKKDKLCTDGDNNCIGKTDQELLTEIDRNNNIVESSIAQDQSKLFLVLI